MDMASCCIKQNEDVMAKEMAAKTVLLNVARGTYYTLNKTGTILWSFMGGNKTVSQMADELAGRFQVSREEALADTLGLIQELKREGLIELVEEKSKD